MLLELAIGDAYGAGFEDVDKKFILKYNLLDDYVKHPWHKLGKGQYTDDTQMSLAIAEAIIEDMDWTPLNLAEKFVQVFKRDPRKGYSKKLYSILHEVNNGRELLKKIDPHSDKSGAAMRATPIGIFKDRLDVMRKAKIQAQITHDTEDGICAAQASALMAHFFIYRIGSKCDLGEYLLDCIPGFRCIHYDKRIGSKGLMSVSAAITAIKGNESMADILKFIVNLGGDTDTAAAIALGSASFSPEIKQDLPEILYQKLERSPFGYCYLEYLDRKLKEKTISIAFIISRQSK